MSKNIEFIGHTCPERDNCADASTCACGYAFEVVQRDHISPYFPIYVTSAKDIGYNFCTVREKDE